MAKVLAASEPPDTGVRDDQWRIPKSSGSGSSRSCRPGRPTPWVATIPGSMTVRRWTPSSSYSGPDANGIP